jgi:nitrite reductase/ring-hydroxylating ferredoxin subunit
VKVAQTADIGPGSGKQVVAGGKTLAIFNVDGSYYAIDDTCPHVGAPLSEGTTSGTVVECPWHAATFDLASGQVKGGPAAEGVSCYKVRVTGEAIEIEV